MQATQRKLCVRSSITRHSKYYLTSCILQQLVKMDVPKVSARQWLCCLPLLYMWLIALHLSLKANSSLNSNSLFSACHALATSLLHRHTHSTLSYCCFSNTLSYLSCWYNTSSGLVLPALFIFLWISFAFHMHRNWPFCSTYSIYMCLNSCCLAFVLRFNKHMLNCCFIYYGRL